MYSWTLPCVSSLWYPPFYTSPMASSALQHWTASPTKEGCHWHKLVEKIVKHDSWPIQHDILSPPLLRLTTMVSTEPLSHGTGTPRCLQKEMATYKHWSVSLWRDPDDVPHCRILSPDKTEWRLISATLCGWKRCFVAPPVMVNDTHTRRRRLIVPHRIIMKLVHFPLTGGLLHLVQRWGDWAGL